MNVREKKALWFPRSILLIAFICLFAYSVINKFAGYGQLVLFLLLILLFVFIFTFFQPIVSGLFYILSSAPILVLLSKSYDQKVFLMINDFNIIPLVFWLILGGGIFLILTDLFPHMFDYIEFTKW